MTLHHRNKAGLPYTASDFGLKVNWLIQKVEDHADKLFRCKATEVVKAEETRMRAVHRWERSMLVKQKKSFTGEPPISSTGVSTHCGAHKQIPPHEALFSGEQIPLWSAENGSRVADLAYSKPPCSVSCQRVKDIFPGQVSTETAKRTKQKSISYFVIPTGS